MLTTNFNTRLGLLAAALALGSPLVPAALHAAPSSPVYSPKPGSRERAELVAALRDKVAQSYHVNATFKVKRLKVGGGYAYFDGAALGPDGKPFGTLGEIGGQISAFYQKRNGHWTLVRSGSDGSDLGPGVAEYDDTHVDGYAQTNFPSAPKALFSAFAPAKPDAASVSTPAPGSRERAELIAALRGSFAQTHPETVTFDIYRLKVGGGYAYLDGVALGANGKPARSLAKTEGTVSAFYQKKEGHWTVVKWGSEGVKDLAHYARQNYPNAPHALYPS